MPNRHRLPLIAAAVIALFVSSGAASASETCHGLHATIVQAVNDQITDSITQGTRHRDVIVLHHAGIVHAGGGNDVICGSPEDDVIDSGAGADIVLAGGGNDTISTGSGVDHVFGEGGSDRINSGSGRDFVVGGAGVDALPRQSGDVVAGGQYGVSVMLTAQQTMQFASSGEQIGLARGEGGMPILAAEVQPMFQNGFGLGAFGAYFTTQRAFPATVLTPTAQTEAPLGSQVVIDMVQNLMVLPGQGSAQSISIANNASMALTTGLTESIVSDNWSQSWTPINVAPFATNPGMVQQFVPPTAVSIFATVYSQPGFVLSALPTNAATTTVSAAHPTATFIWNDKANAFVATNS